MGRRVGLGAAVAFVVVGVGEPRRRRDAVGRGGRVAGRRAVAAGVVGVGLDPRAGGAGELAGVVVNIGDADAVDRLARLIALRPPFPPRPTFPPIHIDV